MREIEDNRCNEKSAYMREQNIKELRRLLAQANDDFMKANRLWFGEGDKLFNAMMVRNSEERIGACKVMLNKLNVALKEPEPVNEPVYKVDQVLEVLTKHQNLIQVSEAHVDLLDDEYIVKVYKNSETGKVLIIHHDEDDAVKRAYYSHTVPKLGWSVKQVIDINGLFS